MRIKICNGKGDKDRFTILSKNNLDILSEYWRAYKPKHPDNYLFLTKQGNPMSSKSIQDIFNKTVVKAGIHKNVTVHKNNQTNISYKQYKRYFEFFCSGGCENVMKS